MNILLLSHDIENLRSVEELLKNVEGYTTYYPINSEDPSELLIYMIESSKKTDHNIFILPNVISKLPKILEYYDDDVRVLCLFSEYSENWNYYQYYEDVPIDNRCMHCWDTDVYDASRILEIFAKLGIIIDNIADGDSQIITVKDTVNIDSISRG